MFVATFVIGVSIGASVGFLAYAMCSVVNRADLGANIGAPRQPNLIQVSDAPLEVWAADALDKQGLVVNQKARPEPENTRGEASIFQRGGARYVVLACGCDVFHSAADRWPDEVDVAILARYATSIANGAAELARQRS